MGCGSSSQQSKDQSSKSKKLDKELQKRREEMKAEVKILLLGAGESGKSTVVKHMKILTDGFSKEELITYRPGILRATIRSMYLLVKAVEKFELKFDEAGQEAARVLEETYNSYYSKSDSEFVWSSALTEAMEKLWQDENIKEAYKRRAEIHLMDGAEYCFENVRRLGDPSYIPTETDILRVRIQTTGIIELKLRVEDRIFNVVDVGGQRSERKKWIHCFQDVDLVLFVVSLSEYDMTLYEDRTVNRMQESLDLFSDVTNSKWFVSTPIMLFLNKSDLFREKIQTVDLKDALPDYEGGCNFDPAIAFVQEKFTAACKGSNKRLFIHVTCATDKQKMQAVFQATKEIILNKDKDTFGPL